VSVTLRYRIRTLYATAAEFSAENPTLLEGELATESDTGLEKVGDGVSDWASLPYRPNQIYVGDSPPADTGLLWLDTSD
jgi:hypothetical protein